MTERQRKESAVCCLVGLNHLLKSCSVLASGPHSTSVKQDMRWPFEGGGSAGFGCIQLPHLFQEEALWKGFKKHGSPGRKVPISGRYILTFIIVGPATKL